MPRYVFISGTAYEVTAPNLEEAYEKVYAFISSEWCPCGAEDCECVFEGDCLTELSETYED